jgi:hypothetical protein
MYTECREYRLRGSFISKVFESSTVNISSGWKAVTVHLAVTVNLAVEFLSLLKFQNSTVFSSGSSLFRTQTI